VFGGVAPIEKDWVSDAGGEGAEAKRSCCSRVEVNAVMLSGVLVADVAAARHAARALIETSQRGGAIAQPACPRGVYDF